MPTEYYIVEYTSNAKDIADRMGFSSHVFDVNNLGCYIAWSSTPYEQVIWLICYRC